MSDNTMDNEGLKESSMEPVEDSPFSFGCHPNVPCFTQCCSDLNLALTPYDVLRLKNRLGISSGEFLDRYTTDEVKHNCGLPVMMFKMKDDPKRTCPFLGPEGCRVYGDRPGACRLYPVARAAKYVAGRMNERYFLLKEPHCLGFKENKEWTTGEWMEDQGLEVYNKMNTLWMAINQGVGEESTPPPITDEKLKMYFMSCYNLNTFRNFVFESRLLKLFQVDKRTVSRIQTNETELLKFAFKWLQFAIFAKKTMKPKKSVIQTKKRATGRI
jgi:Fe-S-cluster containining protein